MTHRHHRNRQDSPDTPDWYPGFMDTLTEPLGMTGEELDRLAHWDQAPAGTCRTCHRGPLAPNRSQCLYCRSLADLRSQDSEPVRHNRGIPGAVLAILLLIFVWITVVELFIHVFHGGVR